MEIKQQELDSQHLRLPFYIIFDLRESSIPRKWRRYFARRIWQGRIQDFFRRGCSRLLLYFNTNKPHSFFCRIPVVLENSRSSQRGGGGGAHPLHPPPRSAPNWRFDRKGLKGLNLARIFQMQNTTSPDRRYSFLLRM